MIATSVKLNMDYDPDHDILYISIGTPIPSYCDKDIEGVLFRKSMDDHKLSGVTIMDYSKKNESQLKRILPPELDTREIRAIFTDFRGDYHG